jgi:hypothetical protein
LIYDMICSCTVSSFFFCQFILHDVAVI